MFRLDPMEFDDIIVGAGTAGCTLANRLTEDAGCRVLLQDVEIGEVRVPAGANFLVMIASAN